MAQRRKGISNERWVIKAGSQLVCKGGALILRSWMDQVAALKRRKIEVIWVTSGAIASARDLLKVKKSARLPEKQALSAIGQPLVMDRYLMAMGRVGLRGAQILLTADDLAHRERRLNLKNTLNTLVSWGVIPVLNENDAVATDEIKFGDNDSLSARVARVMGADRLVILTDVDGLFTEDPKVHPEAPLLRELKRVPKNLLNRVEKSATSTRGTGGMYSKLLAAQYALRSGVVTHLIPGMPKSARATLLALAAGETVGTRIG